MRNKIILAGIICCCVGVVGLAISLPMAVKDGIGIYNELVGSAESNATETVLEEPITELKLIQTARGMTNVIKLFQSQDGKIHIWDTTGTSFRVQSVVKDGKATVSLIPSPQSRQLSRESIQQSIARATSSRYQIELAIPSTVKLTSQESDGFYFEADSSIEFVNAEEIRTYSYQPAPSETLERKRDSLQEQVYFLQNKLAEKDQELFSYYEQNQNQNQNQNQDEEYSEIFYGDESSLQQQAAEQAINDWAGIIREERQKIASAKLQYAAEEITEKEYWQIADPAFGRLKAVCLREARLTTQGKSKQEAVQEELSTLCDKEMTLNEKEIEEIKTNQLFTSDMLTEGDYQTNMVLLAQDKIKLQTEISKLTKSLHEMGYDASFEKAVD